MDAFVFDLDEPDIIRALCQLGPRLRIFMDNSESHVKATSMEPLAKGEIDRAHGMIREGKFSGLAHDKVFIQKKDGNATKVLTGSANFTLRGLYVQSNSVLVFNDPVIAGLYEEAFDQAFTDEKGFKGAEIARVWHPAKIGGVADLGFSFAPHKEAFSLDTVAGAITGAESSVMFSMMETGGGGPVMSQLKQLGDRGDIFSLGTVQKRGQLGTFKQGVKTGYAPFDYLEKNAPDPFKPEWSGGGGQVIHHKFVVCDFNGRSPVVYCGSSNLCLGGEKSNGDNLIEIRDRRVATLYAIEAIRLYDHYRFRSMQRKNTLATKNTLMLDDTDAWTQKYYDPGDYKFHERMLLCLI